VSNSQQASSHVRTRFTRKYNEKDHGTFGAVCLSVTVLTYSDFVVSKRRSCLTRVRSNAVRQVTLRRLCVELWPHNHPRTQNAFSAFERAAPPIASHRRHSSVREVAADSVATFSLGIIFHEIFIAPICPDATCAAGQSISRQAARFFECIKRIYPLLRNESDKSKVNTNCRILIVIIGKWIQWNFLSITKHLSTYRLAHFFFVCYLFERKPWHIVWWNTIIDIT